ncbi:transmembrane protein 150A [Brienomyrus brachyistius]|uniref:transmembrane protein 150A n=1 Tax=Brienomyrus brachyistius TaxID=42636 RepID=UPI0020B27895|nr:transmembrane protein 150A [Brienomyrus brachyistius]
MVYWIFLPIAVSVVSFIGSWAVYGLALSYGHVCSLSNWQYRNSCEPNMSELCCTDSHVPTISTSGTGIPENSLFTATISAGSFLFMVFCVFHHAHILNKCSTQAVLSRLALGFGCVASIGAFVAGNCNPGYLVLLHYLGAAVSFICICFYCLLLTVLTGNCFLTGKEKVLYPVRVLSTALQVLVTLLYCIFFAQEPYPLKHLSAVFEWILSMNLELFELSFVFEFYVFSSSMLSSLIYTKEEEKSLIMS